MSLQTRRQILWLLFQFLFRCLPRFYVPIFLLLFCRILKKRIAIKMIFKSELKSGRDFPTATMDPNRQGGLHMNAGSGSGQIFTSMTINTSKSLEVYPVTTPPPKRVSDWMCPTVIHKRHLYGKHSKFSIARKSERHLCRNAAARIPGKDPPLR